MTNGFRTTLLCCITLLVAMGDLYAQSQPPTLRTEIGVGTPAPYVQKSKLSSLLFSRHPQIASDSTLISPPPYSPQKEVAGIDPGIWLKPDSTIDAKIMHLTPRADVDPKMILSALPHKPRRK